MPDIRQTSLTGDGAVAVNVTTLSSSELILSQPDGNQFLVIDNTTGASVTPKLVGSKASAQFEVKGVGYKDLSEGLELDAIPAGETAAIPLHSIREWLKGVVTLTGCGGCVGYITTQTNAPVYDLFIQGGRLAAYGRLTADSKLWSL